MTAPIDLRSDTVTRPTPAMRRAMAEAEVGDDVYREDPTIRRLEERVAERLGLEAGVYVPSGTQGNQCALGVHCPRGTEAVMEERSHTFHYENGAVAASTSPRNAPQGRLVVISVEPASYHLALPRGSFETHS